MKLSKEDIDFPKYCLFFIKKIQEELDKEELNETTYSEVIVESIYPYCSDAFDLIMKTFERKGIDVMIPTFKVEYKLNVKYYIYKWKFRKLIKFDDLPFE